MLFNNADECVAFGQPLLLFYVEVIALAVFITGRFIYEAFTDTNSKTDECSSDESYTEESSSDESYSDESYSDESYSDESYSDESSYE